MTSAARTCRSPGGFTLIEIVLVLAIASVLLGGAVGVMVYSSDERVLRDTSGEIELLAKQARTTAILHQTPYAVEFREGIVRLLPLAEAGQDEKRTVGGRRIGGEPVRRGGKFEEYSLEPGVRLFVRRWNADTWLPSAKNAIHIWRFDPDGLCEPLAVRLETNKSWVEDVFHPLTATIHGSQSEFQ